VSDFAVDDELERLHRAQKLPDRARIRAEVMATLDRVLALDAAALARAAESQLAHLSAARTDDDVLQANRALHVLFDLFEKRGWREGRVLVERALLEPRFLMKERYLQTLEDFADRASVPVLMQLLAQPGDSVADSDLRAATLAALAGYFPPPDDARAALALLGDDHLRTRANAVQFVSTHEIREAGPPLVERIVHERDLDVLADLLALVERWSPPGAIAAIERRLAHTDEADEVREALVTARQALLGQAR
jgi:hypothetical protein